MLSDSVHHDTESENVTSHDENREQDLAESEELASKGTHQNFTSICQVLNVRISLMKLADNVASVRGEDTQPNNENNSPESYQFTCISRMTVATKLTGRDPAPPEWQATTRHPETQIQQS